MQKLVPAVCVPIDFRDIFKSLWSTISSTRIVINEKFANRISDITGFNYVRTFQSGYLALYYLLLQIKGKKVKGEIITPVYTCPSIHYAVVNAGLTPVYVDSDFDSFNTCFESVKNQISTNTVAIMVLHLFGCYSFDIEKLRKLLLSLGREDILIIEDMCQALGDVKSFRYSKKQYGDYGILSFGRAKMISTVNGGALISNSTHILNKIPRKCNSGVYQNLHIFFKSIIYSVAVRPVIFRFSQSILVRKRAEDPFNLKDYINIDHSDYAGLTTYQAGLGLKMLDKLSRFNSIRKENAQFYLKFFVDRKRYRIQPIVDNFYLRFAVVFKYERDCIFINKFLYENGINTSSVNYPLLSEIKNFNALTHSKQFYNASKIATNILTFPTHPEVKMEDYESLFQELFGRLKRMS